MTQRVLIVDDSWFQRLNVRNLLESGGYEFSEAEDGAKAIQLIQAEMPDCILLDLVMPGVDGFEVLETMQRDGIQIPTVVASADIQNSTRQRCLKLGAQAVVNKPLTADSGLLALVQELLAN